MISLDDVRCQGFVLRTPTLWDTTDVLILRDVPVANEYALSGLEIQGDVTFRIKARATGSGINFFLLLGYSGPSTAESYYFQFRDGAVNLFSNGRLASRPDDIVSGRRWVWVEVVRNGDVISASYPGGALSIENTDRMAGKVGFGSYRSTAEFDSVYIVLPNASYFYDFESVPIDTAWQEFLTDGVRISWDANTEFDLAEYRIYRNGAYHSSVGAGFVEQILSGHVIDKGNVVFVTAVDTAGNESGASNKVFYKIVDELSTGIKDTTAPAPPTGLEVWRKIGKRNQ